MFGDVFQEALSHDGVVSITTWAEDDAHVSNTWNKYIRIIDGNKLLIPAAWMFKTEKNVQKNPRVILTLGSPDVQGKMGMGTGFVIDGTAKFLDAGAVFDDMKRAFPFLSRVLEVTASSVKQTI
jgi:predicted pyridoxine 5'-phosphate oxidase superfamily flavin-nucleotide-binding protein